ncbi:MAG: chemotaxis protein CheW [Pseudomonadota bacterium]|nr:chemotaxis protein CheW [Pseudomonadota bacterium]
MAKPEVKEAYPSGDDEGLTQQQYLTFMLGGETFAIGILAIKEIIEYGNLTEVPRMPEFIRGVINLRGAVVPVIDLSARFGKRATQVARRTCIVILEVDNGDGDTQDIGILVDAVNEVLEIPESDIEPAPSFGASIKSQFINGMGKVNERFVIILDIGHILLIDELSALAAGQPEMEEAIAQDDEA